VSALASRTITNPASAGFGVSGTSESGLWLGSPNQPRCGHSQMFSARPRIVQFVPFLLGAAGADPPVAPSRLTAPADGDTELIDVSALTSAVLRRDAGVQPGRVARRRRLLRARGSPGCRRRYSGICRCERAHLCNFAAWPGSAARARWPTPPCHEPAAAWVVRVGTQEIADVSALTSAILKALGRPTLRLLHVISGADPSSACAVNDGRSDRGAVATAVLAPRCPSVMPRAGVRFSRCERAHIFNFGFVRGGAMPAPE
jgi:hypothetical protein